MLLSHIAPLSYCSRWNGLLRPPRLISFQLVSDGSIAMQSSQEERGGTIVSDVRQAGLIIVQRQARACLDTAAAAGCCDGPSRVSAGGWEGHVHAAKVKSHTLQFFFSLQLGLKLSLRLLKPQTDSFFSDSFWVRTMSSDSFLSLKREFRLIF